MGPKYLLQAFSILVAVHLVAAHIEINHPDAQWPVEDEEQEQGLPCGGATRPNQGGGYAWFVDNAWISLSGDPGQTVNVLYFDGFNTTRGGPPDRREDFNITVVANTTFPESGNLCVNATIPGVEEFAAGRPGVIWVEAVEGDESVSACTDITIVPGADALTEPAFAQVCSNGTFANIPCECHCHGREEHCEGNCTSEEEQTARTECENAAATRSARPSASNTAPPAPSGSNAAAVSARLSTFMGGSSVLVSAGVTVVAMVVSAMAVGLV